MSATRERPILFNDEMVRAILDGRKTETRRVVLPQPPLSRAIAGSEFSVGGRDYRCPYGQPGDRLWVREAHYLHNSCVWARLPWTRRQYIEDTYRGPRTFEEYCFFRASFDRAFSGSWRPSIHMPRWASRLTLELTEVGVERLQDITGEGVVREGVDTRGLESDLRTIVPRARVRFAELWNDIYARCGFSWDANPWVWVVRFKLLEAAHE